MHATFVGNHAGVPRIRRVLPGFAGCSQGSCPYFLGLAVDSRSARTGLKVWRCSGCGEDVVDEVDALWCGQEWAVLGVLVEVPHEGVEAGEGDADALGRDAPRSVVCVGVRIKNNRRTVDDVVGDVVLP